MPVSIMDLNGPERWCLLVLYMPEPLDNLPGVGKTSIDRLVSLGLIEEDPETPLNAAVHYRRTDEGTRIRNELIAAGCSPV